MTISLEEWQKSVLLELEKEEESYNPIKKSMRGVRFLSKSRGKKRKKRKTPREVILLQYEIGRWRFYNIEDNGNKKIPWDEWANEFQELYNFDFSKNGTVNPGDCLREEFLQILKKRKF